MSPSAENPSVSEQEKMPEACARAVSFAETSTVNIDNRDPSSLPPCTIMRRKPLFLTMLNTMLEMFHLRGKSVGQIYSSLERQGRVSAPYFVQGVVGVRTFRTPWPMAREVQVKQRISERMQMFQYVLELAMKGRTKEEIAGFCLHNGHSVLELVGMGRSEKQLAKGASVCIYRTELDFLRDLLLFEKIHSR